MSLFWQPHFTNLPLTAIKAGAEQSGNEVYIARTIIGGQLKPGKYLPQHNQMYVAHGQNEHTSSVYQLLTNPQHLPISWITVPHFKSYASSTSLNLVIGGQNRRGDHLFIARAQHNGNTVVGYIDPYSGRLNYSFNGGHYYTEQYELLCVQ